MSWTIKGWGVTLAQGSALYGTHSASRAVRVSGFLQVRVCFWV
nr:MAG TPA: hypothetical protein [Caudoviricetes sp.]